MKPLCCYFFFVVSCLLIASEGYSQISNVGGETYTTEVKVQLRAKAFNDVPLQLKMDS